MIINKANFFSIKSFSFRYGFFDLNVLFDANAHDVIVECSRRDFGQQQFELLQKLPEILANDEELEVGEFELDIFKVKIRKIKTYTEELVKCTR